MKEDRPSKHTQCSKPDVQELRAEAAGAGASRGVDAQAAHTGQTCTATTVLKMRWMPELAPRAEEVSADSAHAASWVLFSRADWTGAEGHVSSSGASLRRSSVAWLSLPCSGAYLYVSDV